MFHGIGLKPEEKVSIVSELFSLDPLFITIHGWVVESVLDSTYLFVLFLFPASHVL